MLWEGNRESANAKNRRAGGGPARVRWARFHCPGDQKVYLDLVFYETLKTQLGAPCDFAQAYVIAHEVGHHVQNLLGITAKMEEMRQRVLQEGSEFQPHEAESGLA